MAPVAKKKGKKVTLSESIRQNFFASLPSQGLSSPNDLSHDQLLLAYGLLPSEGSQPCTALWLQDRVPTPPKEDEKKKKKEPEKTSPDVIVLDSSDEDANKAKKGKGKATPKGKGKANEDIKAKGKEVPACSLDCGPLCLNWLGQEKWEDSKASLLKLVKAAKIGYDPSNERDPGLPVGLRNLGATCYVNSFLQVWFQDLVFRSGVYSCPLPDNGSVEDSPVFQLQTVFAFLQQAHQAVYDPEPFVNSLKLDRTVQQDAQEFSKLFLDLLNHEFETQGRRAAESGAEGSRVASLMSDQFEGTITYGTRCETCDSESDRTNRFHELEINLIRDCKLEDRIREMLKEEKLKGDNRYDCGYCKSMEDAVRYTRLDKLPPVLHFSILRFVFNMKDFSRNKSQHSITYPLQLDMGQFMPKIGNGKQPEMWYDLKGVLMHKGTSAHHGHYVAQVHDSSQGKWFLFDDEAVTPIEDLNAPDRYDQEDDGGTNDTKKPSKPNPGFTRTSSGEILPKSKDAYMLVYTRRDNRSTQVVPPPALAVAKVESLDAKYAEEVEDFQKREAVIKTDFEAARERKRAIYRKWNSQELENGFVVSKNGIRGWIEIGLKPEPKAEECDITLNVVDDGSKVSASTRDGLDSDMKATTAEISGAEVGDVRMEGTEKTPKEIRKDDLREGAGSELGSHVVKPTNGVNNDRVSPELYIPDESPAEQARPSEPPTKSPSITPTAIGDDTRQGEGSDDEVVVLESTATIVQNASIVCEHGLIDPSKASNLKVIDQATVDRLREMGVRLQPELRIKQNLCRRCVWTSTAAHIYSEKHWEDVLEFDAGNTGRGKAQSEEVWISTAWLKDWKKGKPSMHQAGELTDPAPDSSRWEFDVKCPHGNLQPDSKRRKTIHSEAATVLQMLFPEWTTLVHSEKEKPCSRCNKELQETTASVKELENILKKEKLALKSMALQDSIVSVRDTLIIDDDYYVIPWEFKRQWNHWAKGNKGMSRPSILDNNEFLCEHGKVLLDVEAEIDRSVAIALVTDKEWRLLSSNYNAGPPISVQRSGGDDISVSPEVCTACLDAKRKSFSTTTIKIKTLSANDFDKDGNRKSPSPEPEPEERNPSRPLPKATTTYGNSGTRQSSRLKRQPMMRVATKLREIDMLKGDTIKQLKIRINERFKIATIYQRLFLPVDRRELNNDETVLDLDLRSGSTLELYEVPVDDNIDFGKLDDSVPDTKRRKKNQQEGFGGTGLFGWSNRGAVPEQPEPMEVDEHVKDEDREATEFRQMTCPSCTFEQLSVPSGVCEICSLPMDL